MKIRNKKGFTIIESLIYIFMTTLILNEGLYLSILMYKSYLYNAEITKKYNDIQNYYMEFQKIISEKNINEVECSDKNLVFSKYIDNIEKKKSIENATDRNAVVLISYKSDYKFLNEGKMIGNISEIRFKKKKNLIYMIISDEDGKEFISCI